MSNIDFFNSLAQHTNARLHTGRLFSFHVNMYTDIAEDVLTHMPLTAEQSVLDLGGGTGEIANLMSRQCRAVTVADAAEAALDRAKERFAENKKLSFVWCDANAALPFADGQFDAAVCYSVVHYLADHEAFRRLVSELLRVVRPGGRVYVGDIPLSEKYAQTMEERKKHPVKNFILNQRYYFKKFMTSRIYKKHQVAVDDIHALTYTRDRIAQLLSSIPGITMNFFAQAKRLPFANSREDLLIEKRAL